MQLITEWKSEAGHINRQVLISRITRPDKKTILAKYCPLKEMFKFWIDHIKWLMYPGKIFCKVKKKPKNMEIYLKLNDDWWTWTWWTRLRGEWGGGCGNRWVHWALCVLMTYFDEVVSDSVHRGVPSATHTDKDTQTYALLRNRRAHTQDEEEHVKLHEGEEMRKVIKLIWETKSDSSNKWFYRVLRCMGRKTLPVT